MDSGNGPNQQQRYCPTPIMAPPAVAGSPPLMSGGSVMNTLHQPTHHPPPSISPHPGAYYGHHTAGASHYPTPSPTPPPMHHQQYYAHSYYAHGSHQQAQQQQQSQQSQHHAHVPINTPPGSGQPTSQHSHLMGHGSYHHPQSQSLHQQWAAPNHPHQQQSHHYYHQPTHHPQQQQQQQQTQQHGYPPPPHSPYSYVQPHAPPPTPPPVSHTPHAQQQHIQQSSQQQQHQHPPQVSVSPGPGQMHQTPPQQQQQPQQQPQSHALMNLSRFVSQQQSPSPSPRASPNLAASHHSQQISQMGPTSPSPYSGHMEHHPSMNGHASIPPNAGANSNSPVMSPPPAPIPIQQPMSPPSPVSQHPMIMQPQIPPHNINGGDMMERRSPAGGSNVMGSCDERESSVGHTMKIASSSAKSNSTPRELPTVFSNITPSKIASFMNCDLKKTCSPPVNDIKLSNSNSVISQNNVLGDVDGSVSESGYSGMSGSSPVPADGLGMPDGSKDSSDFMMSSSLDKRSSPSKQMGSPSSSGNGHQMMPVRLQNMHKGARTKANMKKLMQEQQITTPNGQITDVGLDSSIHAKVEGLDFTSPKQSPEKPAKSPRKKKSQQPKDSASSVAFNDSLVPMSPGSMDLSGQSDSFAAGFPTVRPGYTKHGKKIGRPRKDLSLAGQDTEEKPKKKKRESKSPTKKSKNKTEIASDAPAIVEVVKAEPPVFDIISSENVLVATPVLPETTPNKKGKSTKTSKKRLPRLYSDTSLQEIMPQVETGSDLNVVDHPSFEEQSHLSETPINQSVTPKTVGKKKSNKKSAGNAILSTDSSPDTFSLNTLPSSIITEQEAESAAFVSLKVNPVPTGKGKRKGKKSTPLLDTELEVATSSRRSKSVGGSKKKIPASIVSKDVTVITSERGELPRLRSRSPKQRESPPLRISSPRAAKERSATPAASNNATPTRSKREKEAAGTPVTTPLSSPLLRSPKKSPGKDKEKVVIRSSSRQKANETTSLETTEVQKDLLSPPPTKRSRQVSKESLDSTEFQKKGRRGTAFKDIRLSTESELSSPIALKRASRRKSGSVTGSTDNLSSASFNQTSSSLSLIPSDGSFDIGSDISLTTTADNTLSSPVEFVPIAPATLPALNKRRKPKKSGKSRSKSPRAATGNVVETPIVEYSEPAAVDHVSNLSEIVQESSSIPLPVKAKPKRSRKAHGKKGKRRASTASAIAALPVDATVDESQVEIAENTTTSVPSRSVTLKTKSRKGASRSKRQKVLLSSTEVSNSVVPAILSAPKKNVKFKTQKKSRKQPKKSGNKKTAEDILSTEEPIVSTESTSIAKSEDFQDLTPSKRRRSSSTGATNTQVSAKTNTHNETEVAQKIKPTAFAADGISSPNISKALRRDSRSVSRDYDVSVVLTDIAQTFTAGDSSLLGISTSLSRLQSPTTTFTPVPTIQSPQGSTSAGSVAKETSASVETPSTIKRNAKKGKRKPNTMDEEQPVKKKQKEQQQNFKHATIQERAAMLTAEIDADKEAERVREAQEAEIAMVLVGMSSKSPSPAKSIPSGNVSQEGAPKKRTKGQKRKHSKSLRRSIDKTAGEMEESVPITLKLDLPYATMEAAFPVVQSTPKGTKRKGTKVRRSSNARKLKKTPTAFLPSMEGEIMSPEGDAMAQSLHTDLNGPIPTTSASAKLWNPPFVPNSTGLTFSPSVQRKAKGGGKSATPSPVKAKARKSKNLSPDICATSEGLSVPQKSPKKVRKQLPNQTTPTLENSHPIVEVKESLQEPPLLASIKSEVSPTKKKRQRKSKASIPSPSNATLINEAVPSTSAAAAAFANQLPSASRLFPYQISPKPYKKPTVFSKSAPITESAKDDDNQKKKAQDAPSLKVIGGKTKFYRGGEVEEIDPEPKLPKEKTQIPTDNAVPWICSFCHLGPHAQKLGDLFGPYFADLPSIYGNPSPKRETWMHGDCALWAGRLLLIGSYLKRLEQALTEADKETCKVCGRNGATIGCLKRGCKEAVHYPCAVRKFWKMDEQNFHSYCPKHIPQ